MVVAFVLQQIEHAAGGPGFSGSRAAKTTRAMRAWTIAPAHIAQGSSVTVKLSARKPVVAQPPAGIAQGQDFRMRGRIRRRDVAVPAFANERAAGNEHRADRNFAFGSFGVTSESQRPGHPEDIGFGGHRRLMVGGRVLRAHSHSIVAGGLPLTS